MINNPNTLINKRTLLSRERLLVGEGAAKLRAQQVPFLLPLCSSNCNCLCLRDFCNCSQLRFQKCGFDSDQLSVRCSFCFLDVLSDQMLDVLKNT
jgi:hypothetical protein